MRFPRAGLGSTRPARGSSVPCGRWTRSTGSWSSAGSCSSGPSPSPAS